MSEFSGYAFADKKCRRKMKYLVVINGDLDLNGAYAFKNKKDLNAYLKANSSTCFGKEMLAVFKISDIT